MTSRAIVPRPEDGAVHLPACEVMPGRVPVHLSVMYDLRGGRSPHESRYDEAAHLTDPRALLILREVAEHLGFELVRRGLPREEPSCTTPE